MNEKMSREEILTDLGMVPQPDGSWLSPSGRFFKSTGNNSGFVNDIFDFIWEAGYDAGVNHMRKFAAHI